MDERSYKPKFFTNSVHPMPVQAGFVAVELKETSGEGDEVEGEKSPIAKANTPLLSAKVSEWGVCCSCVREDEVGVFERFGEFTHVGTPGLHLCCWPVWCRAGSLSVRVQQLDVITTTKTKDNVTVDVKVALMYQLRVEEAQTAFYALEDFDSQVSSYVQDGVRSNVPQLTLDALFLTKTELSHKLLRELRRVLDPFGYDVVTVLVTDLVPDQRVMHAMNEIAVRSAQPESHHATTLSPACARNL